MKIGSCFVCGLNGKESNGANGFENGRLVMKLSLIEENRSNYILEFHCMHARIFFSGSALHACNLRCALPLAR